MSGISGVVAFDAISAGDLHDLTMMHDRLLHRGPDGETAIGADLWSRGRVVASLREMQAGGKAAFAFRRLGIHGDDASRGPSTAQRGEEQWILIDGYIDNHREVRRELGHLDVSSEAEVVLAAYARWGVDCFARLAGMWAIVIVDLARNAIVVSRDRLGIKPLAFAVEHDRLLFASEPHAIAAVQHGGPRINGPRFRRFLAGLAQPAPEITFFEGVEQVPAATWCEIPLNRVREPLAWRRYWDLRPFTDGTEAVGADAVERFGTLLHEAVRARLVGGAPSGVLLSDQVESVLIAHFVADAHSARGSRALGFASVCDGSSGVSSPGIESATAHGALASSVEHLDSRRVFELVPAVVSAQGEPVSTIAVVEQYRAFQRASELGVRVALDAIGADQAFGGDPSYEGVLVREHFRRLRLFRAIRETRAVAAQYGEPWPLLFAKFLRERPTARRVVDAGGAAYAWLATAPLPTEPSDDGLSRDALNRVLYVHTRWTTLPAALLAEDRNAMASSVEVRAPFLDHRLVEFAFRLPVGWKVDRGVGKKVVRDFARRALPARAASQHGARPIVPVLDLREFPDAVAALRESPALVAAGVRGEALRGFVDAFVAGRHDDRKAIWRLHTARLWLERFTPVPGSIA